MGLVKKIGLLLLRAIGIAIITASTISVAGLIVWSLLKLQVPEFITLVIAFIICIPLYIYVRWKWDKWWEGK